MAGLVTSVCGHLAGPILAGGLIEPSHPGRSKLCLLPRLRLGTRSGIIIRRETPATLMPRASAVAFC